MGKKIGFIRPTFGLINFGVKELFNENKLKKSKRHKIVLFHILHEIFHILGFSPFLFPYFLEKEQIHIQNIRGLETVILASPRVLEAAKKYFKCDNLCGMQLENQVKRNIISSANFMINSFFS